ncbi:MULTISPECIES: EamA family transporter [Aminobacterium]|uniref:EamA family transporter n=1 Tax=Aminobacterium TaxID=81466 RepID=UPI0009FD1902|nr:EamA family transporter [Aminobacterium colombiense]
MVLIKGHPFTGFPFSTWGALRGMALIPQILGHSCYNWTLRYLNPGSVSVALLGESLRSSFLAWLLWRENIHTITIIGGILILLGMKQ